MVWLAGWVWLQRRGVSRSSCWKVAGGVRGWGMHPWRQSGCMRRCPAGEASPYGTMKGRENPLLICAREKTIAIPTCLQARGFVWVCCSRLGTWHSLWSSSNVIQPSLFWKAPHIHEHMYRRHVNCSLCWEHSCWVYTLQPERKEFLLKLVLSVALYVNLTYLVGCYVHRG